MDAMAVADKMKTAKEMVIEWIDTILDKKRWNGTELARKAEISPSTILRLMNDPNHEFVPTIRTLVKISEAANMPIPKKVMDAINVRDVNGGDSEPSRTRSRQSASNVEVRYLSSLPQSLQSQNAPKAIQHVQLPVQLEGDNTAFAFYMFDNSLDPFIKSGALLFASKRRDQASGDMLMITDKSGRSSIRFLMGIDENGLKVSKSLPVKEDETIGFDDIAELAIITANVTKM